MPRRAERCEEEMGDRKREKQGCRLNWFARR